MKTRSIILCVIQIAYWAQNHHVLFANNTIQIRRHQDIHCNKPHQNKKKRLIRPEKFVLSSLSSNEGSGESAQMRRLALAFAACLVYTKYESWWRLKPNFRHLVPLRSYARLFNQWIYECTIHTKHWLIYPYEALSGYTLIASVQWTTTKYNDNIQEQCFGLVWCLTSQSLAMVMPNG